MTIEVTEHNFNANNILSNEQYSNYVWHSVQIHQNNMYDYKHQCYGKRYMPVFYEYDN